MSTVPIIPAPMVGGVSSPALAAAVSRAGGLREDAARGVIWGQEVWDDGEKI